MDFIHIRFSFPFLFGGFSCVLFTFFHLFNKFVHVPILCSIYIILQRRRFRWLTFSFSRFSFCIHDCGLLKLLFTIAIHKHIINSPEYIHFYFSVCTRKQHLLDAHTHTQNMLGFTMYTTCVIWLAFVPLYFGTANHVPLRITSMSVTISLSASVTVACLFSPKVSFINCFLPFLLSFFSSQMDFSNFKRL